MVYNDVAGKATKLSNLTSLPSYLFAGTLSLILHFLFLDYVFELYFCLFFLLRKFYPYNYLLKKCGLYKFSDLLLGDHVCEKCDAVKLLDCPWLSFLIMSC